jgi:6-phosphogluconolactonase (cycloisomerase 2 family)
MDPTGAFLYVIADDQTLQVYAVDYFSGGHLAKLTSVSLSGQPAGVAAEPAGRYVYAADATGVKAFSLSPQSGVLTAITLSPAISLSNVAGLYIDPTGKYLYVTTTTAGAGAVFAYTINSDGTLTAISTSPLATPNQPSSMTFAATIQ